MPLSLSQQNAVTQLSNNLTYQIMANVISIEALESAHASEMSKIAKEPVTATLYENEDLYLFGSELGCLRIAQANRKNETKVAYSENLKTFYVAIYSGK